MFPCRELFTIQYWKPFFESVSQTLGIAGFTTTAMPCICDSVPRYGLTKLVVCDYLVKLFGIHDYRITVGFPAAFFRHCQDTADSDCVNVVHQ